MEGVLMNKNTPTGNARSKGFFYCEDWSFDLTKILEKMDINVLKYVDGVFERYGVPNPDLLTDPLAISVINSQLEGVVQLFLYHTDPNAFSLHLNKISIWLDVLFKDALDRSIMPTLLAVAIETIPNSRFNKDAICYHISLEDTDDTIQTTLDCIKEEFSLLFEHDGVDDGYADIEEQAIIDACYNTITSINNERYRVSYLLTFTNTLISLYGVKYGVQLSTKLLEKLRDKKSNMGTVTVTTDRGEVLFSGKATVKTDPII